MIRLDNIEFVFLAVKEPEVETASNSTIEPDTDITKMTATQLTVKLYDHLQAERAVNIDGKLPALDDVRAIIATDFAAAGDLWKATAPKKVVSRYSAICH